jgi:hypothetical protein
MRMQSVYSTGLAADLAAVHRAIADRDVTPTSVMSAISGASFAAGPQSKVRWLSDSDHLLAIEPRFNSSNHLHSP